MLMKMLRFYIDALLMMDVIIYIFVTGINK